MKVKEQVMRWVFAATAAFSIAAVALICVFLFLNGLPFFTKYDLGAFLSGTTWKPANDIFGILPMIVGSLYVTGGALLFGAPVGIQRIVIGVIVTGAVLIDVVFRQGTKKVKK